MGVSIHLNRSWTKRAAALAAITGAAFYGIAAGGTAQATPGTSALITITGVSPHHVAALTANQVITVTGTGFDEDSISGVTIAHCTTDPMYIVQSSTTLLLKTANDCAVDTTTATTGEATVGRVITITDTAGNSDTAVSNPVATGGKMDLHFVAAPNIATASATVRPVVTEYSQSLAYASQVHTGSSSGGTLVRVLSGSTAFVNNATYPLGASLGGVALTSVTMHTGGDYFTGILGAHAALATPVLKITSNGVTKSFSYGAGGGSATDQTHDFTYAGTTVSVSPAFGGIAGGNTLTVSGAGFTSGTTVTVGGNSCPVTGTATATKVTCTVPAGTASGPVKVVATTGSLVSVVSSGSSYTYLDQ